MLGLSFPGCSGESASYNDFLEGFISSACALAPHAKNATSFLPKERMSVDMKTNPYERYTELNAPVIDFAARLSTVELIVGSAVHSLKVPLGGNLLSLNQGYFLCRFVNTQTKGFSAGLGAFEISLISASIKSLSVAGNKLGPMISIAAQGGLFAIPVCLFGNGLIGQTIGMIFLALWSFIQPMITFFIVFGTDFARAFHASLDKLNDFGLGRNLIFLGALIVIGFKLLIACFLPVVITTTSESRLKNYEMFLSKKLAVNLNEQSQRTAFRGAIHDLTRPFSIISFLLMSLYYSGLSVAGNNLDVVIKISKSIGIAFVVFYLLRASWTYTILHAIANISPKFRAFAVKAQNTAKQIQLLGAANSLKEVKDGSEPALHNKSTAAEKHLRN